MPASSSARSSSLPAGPTNGWPARSSSSPGCSPTSMSSARRAPSPKTVCVAALPQIDTPRQSLRPRRGRFGERGTIGDELSWRSSGSVVCTSPSECRPVAADNGVDAQRSPARSRRCGASPATFVRRIGLPRSARPQLIVAHRRETSASPTRSQAGTRLPRRIVGTRRDRVPRADLLADIAAVDVGSRRRPRARRESRRGARWSDTKCSASSRARPARRAPRVGHASRHSVQVAALIERRRVESSGRLQMISARNIHDPSFGIDDAGVLADPADAGVPRVDALLHGTGVDVARAPRTARRDASRIHASSASSRAPITSW